MQIYQAISQSGAQSFNNQQIRNNFLVESVFQNNEIKMSYTHFDRVVLVEAMPTITAISLPTYDNLIAEYLLER